MGRPPKSTNKSWKTVKAKAPPCPDGLPEDARAEWQRLSPFLESLGRVSPIDKQALVSYCLSWSSFSRIMRDEFSEPWAKLYADGPRCDIIHPAFPPLLRYADIVYRNAGQFGMTARTRDLEGDNGNRKSIAQKLLEGNRRKVATHQLTDSVPLLICEWQAADVAAPDWMTSRALAEYNELANSLTPMDLFTPLDRTTLAIGCSLYELLLRASEQMTDLYTHVEKLEKDEEGEYELRTYLKEHPLHIVHYQLATFLHKVWKDYGMTARYRRIFNGEQKREKKIPITFVPKVVG